MRYFAISEIELKQFQTAIVTEDKKESSRMIDGIRNRRIAITEGKVKQAPEKPDKECNCEEIDCYVVCAGCGGLVGE